MRMTNAIFITILAGGIFSAAYAQKVVNGGLTGTIQTGTGTTTFGSAAAEVFTTPAGGVFILTQLCVSRPELAFVLIDDDTPGDSPILIDRNSACTTYSPGLPLPKSATILCISPEVGEIIQCVAIGVHQKGQSED